MNCAEIIELEPPPAPTCNPMRLPMGLLGFEQIKNYVLVSNPGEEPFAWLRVEDNTALAFVVVDPFVIMPDYQPDIPAADVEFLGLKQVEDALLLAIVTVKGTNQATVNLKGPLVINRHTRIGKQVILTNASHYSVRHPLPVADAAG